MKRAAIYARVSTDIQAEMGYSLPTQLEACRKYAQANGFTVAAELADDCSGSIPVAERPQGRRLYELVDSGQLQAVIIFTHDRTARDDRVLEYLLLKNYLYDRSVELHYSDTGLDPRTFEGDLIGYIKSYTAAEERRKIVERATRGKLAKARSGKIVLNGHLPYGYQKVGRGRDAHVVVNEEEAEIVKMIFAWYVGGDEFGVPISMGNIAYRLMQMKIPTARGGSYWSVTVVKEILTCEFYAGRAYYGKTRKTSNGKRVDCPKDEWIPIEVPELALVDMATMEAVRERIERNKVLSRRNQKHEYLMTGILRCACCGNEMTGLTRLMNGYEVIYYQCGIRGKRGETGDLICANSSKTISTRKVDAIVWGWLEGLLSDEDKLRKGVRAMAELSQSKVAPRLQRLEAIRDLIEKAERKMKRLVSEIADTEDEFILAALRQELKTASRHKESLQIEKGELERALAQETVTPETEQRIIDMAGAIRERMTDAPFELKRVLLDFLNVRVFFYHDKTGRGLKMECDLPFSLQTMPISPIDLGLSRRRSRW